LFEIKVKVVLLGDSCVGKTTLVKNFLSDHGRLDLSLKRTIGAEISIKRSEYDIKPLGKIMFKWVIFDLAGQYIFRTVHPLYYKGAKAAILVFDVSRKATFENLRLWIDSFIRHVGEPRPMIIIGNKIDLRDKMPCVPKEVGEKYAEVLGKELCVPVYYAETSALYGINVEESFAALARLLVEYAQRKSMERLEEQT